MPPMPSGPIIIRIMPIIGVPLNLKVGNTELPLGLGLITLTLFALCIVNLFTKQVATISGVGFKFRGSK